MRDPAWEEVPWEQDLPRPVHRSRLPGPHALVRHLGANRLAVASLTIVTVLAIAGAFAGALAPYGPDQLDLGNVKAPPRFGNRHPLGTDLLGRDYLSRLLFGIRTTTAVAVIAAAASTALGVAVGALAGYAGRRIDTLLMRMTDLVLTFPALAVVLAAAELAGARGTLGVGIVVSLLLWPRLARAMRAMFISLKQEEFVVAARSLGAGSLRIALRELLPNTLGLVVVHATLAFAAAILAESTVSYLGFGIQPPTPTLGRMIRENQSAMVDSWWLVFFPGLVIVIVSLMTTYLGDALHETFGSSDVKAL